MNTNNGDNVNTNPEPFVPMPTWRRGGPPPEHLRADFVGRFFAVHTPGSRILAIRTESGYLSMDDAWWVSLAPDHLCVEFNHGGEERVAHYIRRDTVTEVVREDNVLTSLTDKDAISGCIVDERGEVWMEWGHAAAQTSADVGFTDGPVDSGLRVIADNGADDEGA